MDPLAALEAAEEAVVEKFIYTKIKPPNFPVGAKVRVLKAPELEGFDLNVVQVYWTGTEDKGYWMLQARMGEDSKACIWAPADHFILEIKETKIDGNINEGREQALEGKGLGDDNKGRIDDSISQADGQRRQEVKQEA